MTASAAAAAIRRQLCMFSNSLIVRCGVATATVELLITDWYVGTGACTYIVYVYVHIYVLCMYVNSIKNRFSVFFRTGVAESFFLCALKGQTRILAWANRPRAITLSFGLKLLCTCTTYLNILSASHAFT